MPGDLTQQHKHAKPIPNRSNANISSLAPVLALLIMIVLVIQVNITSAQQAEYQCQINISSAGNYILNSTCQASYINVLNGTNNAKLYCQNGSTVSSVLFGDNTYNNTLFNCTYSKAIIQSLHNASNNMLSPYGEYNTSFIGNNSNVAIGYYFKFIPRGPNGAPAQEGFAAIMPYALVQFNPGVGGSQQTTTEQIIQDAEQHNYTLPRFGYHAPGPVSIGPQTFPVETSEIYKNRTRSFNPYFFIVPFWGWDVLTFKISNITSNTNFSPTLVYPLMEENIQYPDNTSIYWNYTVIKYDNAPNMTFHFWSGYQVSPTGKVMRTIYNITNGTYSFERGMQTPGIHETIAVLKSPAIREQDNSTTETYGVGLAFCTYQEPSISIPGYYTMAYKYLGRLDAFWPTNKTCGNALFITQPNITINCMGGTINSTNNSIELMNGNNAKFENCRIQGNAIRSQDSSNISVYNSTIIANNATNVPFNLSYSSLKLYNTKVQGFSKLPILNHSNLTDLNGSIKITTTTINYTNIYTYTTIPSNIAPKTINFATGIYTHTIIILLIFLFFVIIIAAIFLLLNRQAYADTEIHKPSNTKHGLHHINRHRTQNKQSKRRNRS